MNLHLYKYELPLCNLELRNIKRSAKSFARKASTKRLFFQSNKLKHDVKENVKTKGENMLQPRKQE